jgi:putative ATPase
MCLGVPKLKEVIDKAADHKKYKQHTIVFVDEIHRFNKLQQDALLPSVESGVITLIGATTGIRFLKLLPVFSNCDLTRKSVVRM